MPDFLHHHVGHQPDVIAGGRGRLGGQVVIRHSFGSRRIEPSQLPLDVADAGEILFEFSLVIGIQLPAGILKGLL